MDSVDQCLYDTAHAAGQAPQTNHKSEPGAGCLIYLTAKAAVSGLANLLYGVVPIQCE